MIRLIQKIALYLLILLGIVYGYRYVTGRSIATLPGEIVGKLQQKGPAESTNPKYYSDPARKMQEN